MSLDTVKQEIMDEAEQQAADIIDDAEAEAEQIKEDARDDAQQIKEEITSEAHDEAEAYRKEKIATAKREAKQTKLKAKQELIEKAFDQLEDRIQAMPDDERATLANQALVAVEDDIDIGRIEASPAIADALETDAEVVANEEIDGLIIENTDGTVSYDYTFRTLLDEIRSKHRKDLADRLF
ncbi:MAG: V-type ATP synthase subunit E family protein [Candidatus Nanohaloarchaeota archaeon QJJ-5]|nr:V-type ATP synthase subunit E family protein [Candidatus Nanohaloarchaeota archaeon QJJ-5]